MTERYSRTVTEHLRPNRPGSVLHHGAGSLGWSGGAAVGAKLACPERTVVSLVGDGSFLFTAALTVIYDNRGWAGPKFSTLQVHPDGPRPRPAQLLISDRHD